eukprot:CAMPEP_0168427656 /NCGR_PEP_ID=MMETSP0228-20121227/36462_1 /TAXON_ID=133427 /ORGANISM="Protoceratium reticulatum, Strain CCCM 535 (=CCMP 1889)" /LENGTH=182 /DNA_ID=CAMNT_0008441707 /DNA_START=84 /DNA_END=629 /DNA_ORIENTATION=+
MASARMQGCPLAEERVCPLAEERVGKSTFWPLDPTLQIKNTFVYFGPGRTATRRSSSAPPSMVSLARKIIDMEPQASAEPSDGSTMPDGGSEAAEFSREGSTTSRESEEPDGHMPLSTAAASLVPASAPLQQHVLTPAVAPDPVEVVPDVNDSEELMDFVLQAMAVSFEANSEKIDAMYSIP